LVTAPRSDRVDLAKPVFSDPTSITNARFPISEVTQMIQLGTETGKPLRVEASLLPETRTINWNGQDVEAVVSQFIAYLDGRVVEVATDFFAQADDGAVWYLGEDVTNYEDGVVKDHEGTWLAGKDGPAGMIMPADPRKGDVYRPENVPGFVFEEVTVKAVDVTVEGPRGPVPGAVEVEELLMDGTREAKTFAPGYGEFSARTEDEEIKVALAVPVDGLPGATPPELLSLSKGAGKIFAEGASESWDEAAATLATMTSAAETFLAGEVPERLTTQLREAVDTLAAAVEAEDRAKVRSAAVVVDRAAADLRLRHEPLEAIDAARLAAWSRQLIVDAEADDTAGVAGDVVVLDTIWARTGHTVDPSAAADIEAYLKDLRTAVEADDLAAAARAASDLAGSAAASG